MSKNTNKNTNKNTDVATAPATSNSLARLAEIEAKQKAMREELAKLAKEAETEKGAIRQEVADKMATLPELFGVTDLDAFAELFRTYRNDLRNGTGNGRSIVSPELKKTILDAIRASKAPDATPEQKAAGVLSTLVSKHGVSYQNIRNWGIAAGLITVQKRETVA